MKCAPIFSYMKYKKFDIHIWKYAPYLHTWNIENSITIDGNLPPYFHIWNTKKPIFHIWNMHLYYHTWNIENSIFIYEICTWLGPLFHPWNLGSRGFNGWTVMGLKWPDRVPFIKWPVTSNCLVWSGWDHTRRMVPWPSGFEDLGKVPRPPGVGVPSSSLESAASLLRGYSPRHLSTLSWVLWPQLGLVWGWGCEALGEETVRHKSV